MFRFYLNNTLVSDPINWMDFSETIERDDNIKGLLPKYEIKLRFNAGGYDVLFNELISGGFCQLIELRIERKEGSAYIPTFNGYIFLTECQFNLNKKIVDCEVEDNNYGARIFRNKSIKIYIDTDKTKNGEDLTLCDFTDTYFFTPSTGAYSATLRKCFEVKDAFRTLIEFMTDNLVGFESDYLDTINMTIISGNGIRVPASGLAPFVSFEDLFKEVNKKFPISFTMITGADGRPTIKIEDDAYFFNSTNSIQIDDIEDLRQSFNNEVLYSSVRFGSDTVDFDVSIHSFGYIRFLSFRDEEYFLQGSCNVDKVLDLYGDFICDSNIIEELFVTNTSNDTYDANIFFIEESLASAVRTVSPTTLAAPYYYNASLTNKEVSARYNYNGSLALYLSGTIVGFRASKTVTEYWGAYLNAAGGITCPAPPDLRSLDSTQHVVTFTDDFTLPNYDTAGYYNGNDTYTAGIAGEYVFESSIAYSPENVVGYFFNMYYKGVIQFRRYNSLNVLVQSDEGQDPLLSTGFYSSEGWHVMTHSVGWTLDIGDYVKVVFYFKYCPVNCLVNSSILMRVEPYLNSTWFRTLSAPTSGGVFQPENTTPYRASKFEFEYPLANDTYENLKLDLSKAIVFNYAPNTNKTGWLRKSQRIYATGQTKIELISNITNSQ